MGRWVCSVLVSLMCSLSAVVEAVAVISVAVVARVGILQHPMSI
jgi:hypothetical protein